MLTVIRLIPPALSKPVLIPVILSSFTAKCFNPSATKWEKYESSRADVQFSSVHHSNIHLSRLSRQEQTEALEIHARLLQKARISVFWQEHTEAIPKVQANQE